MHFVLLCPSDESQIYDRPDPFAAGTILPVLDRLKTAGHTYEVIDSDSLTDDMRMGLYVSWETQAVMTGNAKNYRVRNVFGSSKHGGGSLFGKQVPALVVFPESYDGVMFPPDILQDFYRRNNRALACDIYPHKIRHNGEVSIRQYLQSLLDEAGM